MFAGWFSFSRVGRHVKPSVLYYVVSLFNTSLEWIQIVVFSLCVCVFWHRLYIMYNLWYWVWTRLKQVRRHEFCANLTRIAVFARTDTTLKYACMDTHTHTHTLTYCTLYMRALTYSLSLTCTHTHTHNFSLSHTHTRTRALADSPDQLEWHKRYCVLAKDDRKLFFYNDTEVSFMSKIFKQMWSIICNGGVQWVLLKVALSYYIYGSL